MTQFFLLHTVASSRAATTRWPLCPCTMRGIVRCSWFDRRAAVRHPPPPAPPEDAQLDSSHGPQPRTHSSTVPRPCQAASLASGEARSSAPGPAETRGVVQSSSAASACLEHGSLFVHLLGAQKLKASGRNPNGKSDPYAILLLAGQRAKSKTVKASLNPLWDETFEFVGVRGELLTQSLQLRILDWDERTDGRTDGWDGASSAADDWLQNNNNLGQASLRLEPLLHVHALLPGTTKQALGGRRSLSMVKLPALAAPQLDPSASSGRARRLWAARYTQSEAQPLGTPPPPQGLKRAASKVADSTAFDHPGAHLPRRHRPRPRAGGRVGARLRGRDGLPLRGGQHGGLLRGDDAARSGGGHLAHSSGRALNQLRPTTVKTATLAAPQLGPCASSGRACWPRAARHSPGWAPNHWDPSRAPRGSSEPPPKSCIWLRVTIQAS